MSETHGAREGTGSAAAAGHGAGTSSSAEGGSTAAPESAAKRSVRSACREIAIVLFDGVTALDVTGPGDAFQAARLPDGGPAYRLVHVGIEKVGLEKRAVRSESGLMLLPDLCLDHCPEVDTVIVPGGAGLRDGATNAQVAAFLSKRASSVRRLVTVCTGIYGLAPTGLLDGRRATSHWQFLEDLTARFPRIEFVPDAIFVRDGSFATSAGVTAGIDLSLALIEEDLGAAAALAVARELVVYLRRAGGQRQFSEPLQVQFDERSVFGDLVPWALSRLSHGIGVPDLARRVHLSVRQLTRRCQLAYGCSPGDLLQKLRLETARQLLAEPGARVSSVAHAVGLSPSALERAFQGRYGVSPREYRRTFGV